MSVQDYRDLEVWQQAMEQLMHVYRETSQFPGHEIYALTSQLRLAAVSIASNIAEGEGRRTTREFLNHLSIARGSLLEVQTQIESAHRLEYLQVSNAQSVNQQITIVTRLLNGLLKALEKRIQT
jgi:four helix bundle protein